MERAFSKFVRENQLKRVVFHSIRHTSITCKLKLTGGDLKAVQGDAGHSGLRMIEDVYSHILDEDRVKTSLLMENTYYAKREYEKYQEMQASEMNEKTEEELKELLSQPEMFNLIRALLEEKKNG